MTRTTAIGLLVLSLSALRANIAETILLADRCQPGVSARPAGISEDPRNLLIWMEPAVGLEPATC
jgi:hypothetical protein